MITYLLCDMNVSEKNVDSCRFLPCGVQPVQPARQACRLDSRQPGSQTGFPVFVRFDFVL